MKMDTSTSVTSQVIILLEERQKEFDQIFDPAVVLSPSYCGGKMPVPFMAQLCPDSVEVAVRNL